ncbi:MAG TPA: hypothetical protein PLD47_01310 [Aggregatilineales bacterium]|nr:hypothetical protein [Anaerolineales bacterium]HRE46337.1 hypothetical protein [Aggregatilineales bacterium]
MPTNEVAIVIITIALLVSVLLSKVSTRLGTPVLLLVLFIGMLLGSNGVGGIYFDDLGLAQLVGSLSLAFVLFSGGLDTHYPCWELPL